MRSKLKMGVGGVLCVLLGVLALTVGCTSPPTPDPDNGVSNASYRMAVSRADGNLGAIIAKLKLLKVADRAQPRPAHSPEWWDAQVQLAVDTEAMLSATLRGATWTAVPAAPASGGGN